MSMDMDFPIDLDEVLNIIDTSEVVVVRFSTVGKRLLLDFRTSPSDRPMVKVVRRVRSAEERFRDLKRMRPGLVLPEQIISFHWPKEVAGLDRMGVLKRIIAKCEASGHAGMESECRKVLVELQGLERAELINAIKGEGYQALWEREPKER